MTKWTNEQLDAINKKDTNIIVSAGAGSGKTAVLSERVLRIIKDGHHINEILVLTFTNAAASEMKERIRKKLKDENLNDELDLIDASYITTFDSFALSLVKKYHYLLNIKPDIKIIDSTIIILEKEKIIEEIFEEYYKINDKKFLKLIGDFCIKDDKNIKTAILNISSKLDLKLNKEDFIINYINKFYDEDKINNDINEYVKLIIKKIDKIKELLDSLKYIDKDYLKLISTTLKSLLNSKEYIDIKNNSIIKLPILKDASEDLKIIKDKINKLVKEINDLCCYNEINDIKRTIISTKEYAFIILEIITKLDQKIKQYKFNNDIYEFYDIALLIIRLIKENNEVRKEIKGNFKEILVDEYQDTNDLQEEFLNLINNNNLYMVGDIKQSIYRFRNANPYIFKNKYDKYSNNSDGIKIDLNKNFRSREEVLFNINEIFNLIMDDHIGGANYKKDHNMIFGNNSYNEKGKLSQDNNMEILSYPYSKDSNFKKEEIEAFIIANDITDKIKNNYKIYDKDNDLVRNIKYSDIVILMDRTTDFDLYKKIFTYMKIPLNQIKDEIMNEQIDLYVIKNLIKFILKIRQNNIDEEFKYLFISIERSFIINENDNTIFNYFINNNYKDSILYNKCLKLSLELDNLSINELIDKIIEEFNYYDKLITIGNIEGSLIRIEKIKESALMLEELGYNKEEFIDYLDKSNNYEIKYSFNDNTSNSVKIMTIHKSKGLEFNICYYAGLYKEFNISDLNERFIYDNKYGLVLPYFNEGIGNTIYKDLLKEENIKEEISEKIRLFYVALTRAKEKMILVEPCYDKNTSKEKIEYRSFKDILDSIKPKILKYYHNIDLKNIKISKDYNIIENNSIYNNIPTNNLKISLKNIPIDNELLNKNMYSKNKNELINKDIKNNMKYGEKVHEIFELIDFKNPNYNLLDNEMSNKIIKFLNHDIFKNINNANIYKEYEFIYLKDDNEYHGIIDLMIEYDNYIDIIDYKLKNIDDKDYIKQLNGYKEYIESISNKKVNIYLYSILKDELKKIN